MDHNGGLTDSILTTTVDAYGYVAPNASGTARCVSVWVGSSSTSRLNIGVYSNVEGAPSALIASAFIVSPASGWAHAALDKDVAVKPGEIYWVGLITAGGNFSFPAYTSCAQKPYLHANGGLVAGTLPASFTTTNTYSSNCGAAIYLGP